MNMFEYGMNLCRTQRPDHLPNIWISLRVYLYLSIYLI